MHNLKTHLYSLKGYGYLSPYVKNMFVFSILETNQIASEGFNLDGIFKQ